MVAIDLPYDKRTITAQIDDENYAGKLVSQAATYHNKLSEQETVEKSLDNPIGSDKLEELARGKHNIVIISSFTYYHPDPIAAVTVSGARCTDSDPRSYWFPSAINPRRIGE